VNAARKFNLISAVQGFNPSRPALAREMNAISGYRASRDERNVHLIGNVSWSAKQAIQMALVICRFGRKSSRGKMALLELSKILPSLRPHEVMAVMTSMNKGVKGLQKIKKMLKYLNVKGK